ncbi:hypothetical protein CEXT_441561, partial [Caerostris extrusa]
MAYLGKYPAFAGGEKPRDGEIRMGENPEAPT